MRIALALFAALSLSACGNLPDFSIQQNEGSDRDESVGAETLSPNESVRPDAEGRGPEAAKLIASCE